ncbi:hypothetical protein MAH1_35310 [Sessilibacter sp. MAH1]
MNKIGTQPNIEAYIDDEAALKTGFIDVINLIEDAISIDRKSANITWIR